MNDLDALDPRCDVEPTYIKGACNHLTVVPVESNGEVVVGLCLTCDQQLPKTLISAD